MIAGRYHRRVPSPRYRCTACGNLTRFDVTSTVRSRAFHHYTVGGDLEREDVEILSESIEEVSCRWCSSAASVVELSAEDAAAEVAAAGDGAGVPVTPPS